MEGFQKKTLKTSRGYTYTYYTADGDKSLPTLFFQHGWPDHAEMWIDVIKPLKSTNHPMIIPDLLGYDGTDKPTDPAEYSWKYMTKDLIEIADTEKADKVISIGHDWGSACASRLYNYYPDRVVGLVNLNVAYMPPSREPFDLDGANAMFQKFFGYPALMYWHLFTAEDGPSVLKKDVGRTYNVLHGTDQSMKYFFCEQDNMRNYLLGGEKEVQLRPYAQDEKAKQAFIDRMNRDGFEGPQCWYKATTQQNQTESDKSLPEGVEKVNVPALYMGGKEDPVCRPEGMMPAIQAGWLPKLEQCDLFDAGHWTPLEVPNEVASKLESWLKKNFAQ